MPILATTERTPVDVDILAAMLSAVSTLMRPDILFYLFLGTCIGTVIAVIPGIGGLSGVAVLLPFTFALDAPSAVAFILGALAVTSTADTIPAVLFGVPGTPTSMVTVLDGYPMGQRGEGGRALGAAFTSSVLGGIIGAILLAMVIPVIMPVLLATTSAELLAFCVLGLAMVAVLSGGSMSKGLASASLGMLIALIGQDSQTATLRWSFGLTYLWDGVSILAIALGMYALPELADLAIRNRAVVQEGRHTQMRGALQGVKDTLRNYWIVIRSSALGTALGVLPAIGPTVIPWLVYSYTTMSTRGESQFGRGDVRGVIASESSNNATVGGTLLPTVALGIPGSAPMALVLGVFLLQGIAPGPDMLSKNLDLTFTMVWVIVLANILGGALAFSLASPLARLVFVRPAILTPMILAVVFIGAMQASRQWEDLIFLLLIGLIGWVMKLAMWPRAPFVLAFLLAPLVEKYFHIATRIHGAAWLLRPTVLIVLLITAGFILFIAYRRTVRSWRQERGVKRVFRPTVSVDIGLAMVALALCIAAYFTATEWPLEARAMPQIVAGLGILTSGGALFAACFRRDETTRPPAGAVAGAPTPGSLIDSAEMHYDLVSDFGDLSQGAIARRALGFAGLCCLFGVISWAIGVMAAVPLFLGIYMLVWGERWTLVLPLAVVYGIGAYALFEMGLKMTWPVPALDVAAKLMSIW